MEIMLTISILVLMAAGYLLMDKLDDFLSGNNIRKIRQDEDLDQILIYLGDSDLDILLAEMVEKNPRLVIAKDYEDYELGRYSAIVALSGDDADNLLLCVKANHATAGITTIARCNDSINLDIFEESGITKVITSKTDPSSILGFFKGGDMNV